MSVNLKGQMCKDHKLIYRRKKEIKSFLSPKPQQNDAYKKCDLFLKEIKLAIAVSIDF